MLLERRAVPITLPPDAEAGEFLIRALVYNAEPDDYGTVFAPGLFADSLADRLPVPIGWHDTREVVGKFTSFIDTTEALFLRGRLTLSDDVPEARKIYALLKDGALTDVSVGFVRQEAVPHPQHRGKTLITRGRLDEVSFVFRGAVSHANVLDVRTAAHARLALAEGYLTDVEADQLIAEALAIVDDIEPVTPLSDDLDDTIADALDIVQRSA